MNFFDREVEDIINKAFRRSKLSVKGLKDKNKRYKIKINTFYNVIDSYLKKIYDNIPDINKIDNIKKELLDIYYGNRNVIYLRKRIEKMRKILRNIYEYYKDRYNEKEFYGRSLSIFKRNKKIFKEIKKFLKIYKKIPNIKDLPTVVIAGLPNVGKSTLLKNLTGSEPEIGPIPFTTKDLMLGYIKNPIIDIQVIDTPGILDRDFSELNIIEKKALYAIEKISNLLIYVFDLTETCGFKIKEQENLFERIKKVYDKDIVIYFSKSDLFDEKTKKLYEEFKKKINYKSFDDYNLLRDYIINFINNKYRENI